MKCHYEVLEVARDASSDDIKKAYRKLAIKWHPDKNLENTKEATEQFMLIQQAFEVLSDPHERAWYDDHREAILKGKVGSQCDDDSLDVYQYFTASCYQGFGDDEKGFYAVYREVFNKISAEDSEYQAEGDSDFEVPSFGKSDSPFEEVNSFYNYWQSYCTKKTYSWLDPYDIRQAPDRRVTRLMEKENKKVRDKARKARNEEIRELVKFVRKRDKRVQAYAQYLRELSAEKAKKSEEKRLEKIKARKSELASHKESEWSKFSNFENELKDIEANLASEFGESVSSDNSDEDEEVVNNNLYCVACNKLFKTTKAFENHEISKKHKENVLNLKQEMEDEDVDLDIEESEGNDSTDEVVDDDDDDDGEASGDSSGLSPNENVEGEDEAEKTYSDNEFRFGEPEDVNEEPLFCRACGKCFENESAVKDHKSSPEHIKNSTIYKEILKDLGSDTEEDDDISRHSSILSGSDKDSILEEIINGDGDLNKDLERVMSRFNELEQADSKSLEEDVDKICAELDEIIKRNTVLEEDEAEFSKTFTKKKKSKKFIEHEESDDDDFDFSVGQSKKQKRKLRNKKQVLSKNEGKTNKNQSKGSAEVLGTVEKSKISETHPSSQDSVIDDNHSAVKSENESDLVSVTSSSSSKNVKKKQNKNNTVNESSDLNTSCAVCKSTFPSKNKLFQHLTKTGHSVYLPEKSSKNQEDEKSSSKKGKNKKSKK